MASQVAIILAWRRDPWAQGRSAVPAPEQDLALSDPSSCSLVDHFGPLGGLGRPPIVVLPETSVSHILLVVEGVVATQSYSPSCFDRQAGARELSHYVQRLG